MSQTFEPSKKTFKNLLAIFSAFTPTCLLISFHWELNSKMAKIADTHSGNTLLLPPIVHSLTLSRQKEKKKSFVFGWMWVGVS